MTKRESIGYNPLDSLLEIKEATQKPKQSKPPHIKHVKVSGKEKQRVTIQISAETVEGAKNAVYWTPGLTLAKLIDNAMKEEVRKLEKKHGKPFDQRSNELSAGRPLK